MKIVAKKFNKNDKQQDLISIYLDSFPGCERVDYFDLFEGVFNDFEMYGFYDGDTLVGLAHLCKKSNFTHCNYLAVSKNVRSKGYGSEILSWIKSFNNNSPIIVDVEFPDDSAENGENRKRRIKFYEKNGFRPGKYHFHWEGTHMLYLICGEDFSPEQIMSHLQHIFPTIKDVKALTKKELQKF